jgi:hypothetical protein
VGREGPLAADGPGRDLSAEFGDGKKKDEYVLFLLLGINIIMKQSRLISLCESVPALILTGIAIVSFMTSLEKGVLTLLRRCAALGETSIIITKKRTWGVCLCATAALFLFGIVIFSLFTGSDKNPTVLLALQHNHFCEGDPVVVNVIVANLGKDSYYVLDEPIPRASSAGDLGLYFETISGPFSGNRVDGDSVLDFASSLLAPGEKWEQPVTLQDYYAKALPPGEYRIAYTINLSYFRADVLRNPPGVESQSLKKAVRELQIREMLNGQSRGGLPQSLRSHVINGIGNLADDPSQGCAVARGELRFSIVKKTSYAPNDLAR